MKNSIKKRLVKTKRELLSVVSATPAVSKKNSIYIIA